jgi:hypothetical protein
VAVVSNSPEVQSGLDRADIVFETLASDGTSHFTAIFHSSIPDKLGPVLSIEAIHGSIGEWTRGLVVTVDGGATPETQLQIVAKEADGQGMVVVAEEDLAAEDSALSPPSFSIFDNGFVGSTSQRHGEITNEISTTLASTAISHWTWDAQALHWVRAQDEEAPTGPQLTTANLLILDVETSNATSTQPFGVSGTGLVASGQMSAAITWTKDSSGWSFYDSTGEPVILLPGTTWVQLVPKDTGNWSVS